MQKNYKKWFVTDENDVNDTLCPGLLKIEYHQGSGDYIGLTPKTYICLDYKGEKKCGQKGIPKSQQIQKDQFLQALYDNDDFTCETQSLLPKVSLITNYDYKLFLETKNVASDCKEKNFKQQIL